MLKIDNTAVRRSQIARLKDLRAQRDQPAVDAALDALTECARSGEGNLLDLSIKAARLKASVGEISFALEKIYGRFQPTPQLATGVYAKQVGETMGAIKRVRALVETFVKAEGRRPRILVAKLGQDGHDRGQQVVASAFADIGFDVDVGPLFQTPEEAAREAVDNDVHVLGVSSLAGGHRPHWCRKSSGRTRGAGATNVLVIAGGVIPPQDYDELCAKEDTGRDLRTATPVISDSAAKILDVLLARITVKAA